MSSISHSRVNTLCRPDLEKAAKELGITLQNKGANTLAAPGLQFVFGKDGSCTVSRSSDFRSAHRQAEKLTQLGTYYTTVGRLTTAGFEVKKATTNPLMAISANQPLVVELEEKAQQKVMA